MNKEDFVLSVFSLAPEKQLSPVQLQKLFFLIERRLINYCGETVKQFNFRPYHYGPFDNILSQVLRDCANKNKLIRSKIEKLEYFHIQQSQLLNIDNFLDNRAREYIIELIKYVSSLSFRDLCFAIYKEFPKMTEKSILLNNG